MNNCISIIDTLNEKKEYENLRNISDDDAPLCMIYLEPIDNDYKVAVRANVDFQKILDNNIDEVSDTVKMVLSDFAIDRMIEDFNNESMNLFYLKATKLPDGLININIFVNGEFEKYVDPNPTFGKELYYVLKNIEDDINNRVFNHNKKKNIQYTYN